MSGLADQSRKRTMSFGEIHFNLQLDPFYGIQDTDPIEEPRDRQGLREILAKIREDFHDPDRLNTFEHAYSLLPCKNDSQRLLILIWCALMGLPAFQNGQLLNWKPKDFLHNWKGGFEVRIADLLDFLRTQHRPLPFSLFPHEIDNTQNKVRWTDEEYELAVYQVTQTLPQLKGELRDVSRAVPEKFSEVPEKNRRIERLNKEIFKLEERYGLARTNAPNLPTTKRGLEGLKRDQELQQAAKNLAEQRKGQGEKSVTKRDIAVQLSKDPRWNDMSDGRIERILRKNW